MAMLKSQGRGAFAQRPTKQKGALIGDRELVRFRQLEPGRMLPLVAEPTLPEVKPAAWIIKNEALVQEKLSIHGAILFRGFALREDADFTEFLAALPQDCLPYLESSTPRKEIASHVYTSTIYPPEEVIALHSENSASVRFPLRLWFFCAQPSDSGGETPLADARAIVRRIDPEVLDRFRRKGWMLIRNYGNGLGVGWRKAFKTEDRAVVESYCRENDIEWQWRDGDVLWTRQVRSATLTHPQTGEEVWFNHMAFWHQANLAPPIRREMIKAVGAEGLPYNTLYGDGSPIADADAHHIRDAYLSEKTKFTWQKGDLLLFDNLLTCHGREAYSGARCIRVAMTHPYQRPDWRITLDRAAV